MFGGAGAVLVFASFSENWFWTSIVAGALTAAVAIGFACYGFYKSGVLRLLWEAVVAAKHGICPPVRIVREGEEA